MLRKEPMLRSSFRHNDKSLFTPGPLSTSQSVKRAMLSDLGSRDREFLLLVKDIQNRLLKLAEISSEKYSAVLMQGSGTFGLESVIGSSIAKDGSLLIIENGAYGRRLVQIAEILCIRADVIHFAEDETPCLIKIQKRMENSKASHIAMVHCETSTGAFNPVAEVALLAHNNNKRFIVDAMSSFGAVPIDVSHIDYLVSSSNKCIEGVPGFSFILAKRSELLSLKGGRSLSLNLFDQWQSFETSGQFRFTPPTHVILAFRQALIELEEEGGVLARAKRYQNNHQIIVQGMKKLGFIEFLPIKRQGYIITCFRYPTDPGFSFETFYEKLNERGFIIYPGKLSDADCFRLGNIGRLFDEDMKALLLAIGAVKQEMGF